MFKDSQSGNPESHPNTLRMKLNETTCNTKNVSKGYMAVYMQFMLCICVYIYTYYIVHRSYLDHSEYTMHNYLYIIYRVQTPKVFVASAISQ